MNSDKARKIADLMAAPALRADVRTVKRSAQALVDGIDGMLWAVQNMPEADELRGDLVACKGKLGQMLEQIGYALKVKGGFKTTVMKVRQPRSQPARAAATAAARIFSAAEDLADLARLLLNWHGGQTSGLYAVGSSWLADPSAPSGPDYDDIVRAISELDGLIAREVPHPESITDADVAELKGLRSRLDRVRQRRDWPRGRSTGLPYGLKGD